MLRILNRHKKEILSWVAITAVSLVVAFIAMEGILRYTPIAGKIAPEGFLFFEHPQTFRDQHREFGYSAFSNNREMLIYSDQGNAWIEYDASFSVNNAGLVQRRDIDPAKPHIVIVGDSFTQGQGATPWFYELERDLPAFRLANLGIMGTGVQHWDKAVDWFQERVAGVQMVAVIFITSDFARPYWIAKSGPDETSFCFETLCKTVITKLFDGSPRALAQSRRESSPKEAPAPAGDSLRARFRALLMKTQTGALLKVLLGRALKSPPQYLEANKRSLEALQVKHKVAFALHLPEKKEVSERVWSAESVQLKNFISAINIPYVDGMERCGLEVADFRKIDAHPNPAGYRKIQKCMGALLKAAAQAEGHKGP